MKPAADSAAMRGKTARACDNCLKKRARWFCEADDAFLCQACNSSVHSANQLASRHLTVRIDSNGSSMVSATSTFHAQCLPSTPAWHQGFIRKARTARRSNNKKSAKEEGKALMMNPPPLQLLVPQMEEDGNNNSNEEEHDWLCRVPVFDPCGEMDNNGNLINGFLDSDVNDDLLEFAADVESLLAAEEGDHDHQNHVKIKDEEEQEDEELGIANCYFSPNFEDSLMGWDFDYELPMIEEEEEEKPAVVEAPASSTVETAGNLTMIVNIETQEEMRNLSLRLNHEAVMAAWGTQGSPWTTGSRPELNPNDYWLQCMGTNMHREQSGSYGGVLRGQMGCSTDHRGREARVSRYREKRRTRLFSKKIRYEVRKLNADKRPRMKGRFVKRTTTTTFVGTNFLTSK